MQPPDTKSLHRERWLQAFRDFLAAARKVEHGLGITTLLHDDVQNLTPVVHGPPYEHPLAANGAHTPP